MHASVSLDVIYGIKSQPDDQGCQMICFQTKNTNLGKSWSALDWKMLVYFMAIWNRYYNEF
jgi:hypothetical protein